MSFNYPVYNQALENRVSRKKIFFSPNLHNIHQQAMHVSYETQARASSSHVCSQSTNSWLYIVLRLSHDKRPFGSLHVFTSGQILNPYPHHYNTAFAFSEIPYPHSHRLALRLTFPGGEVRAYHVPHKYLTSDSGSTFRPAVQHLRWEKSHFPILTAYHFGQGISASFAFFSWRSLSVIQIC